MVSSHTPKQVQWRMGSCDAHLPSEAPSAASTWPTPAPRPPLPRLQGNSLLHSNTGFHPVMQPAGHDNAARQQPREQSDVVSDSDRRTSQHHKVSGALTSQVESLQLRQFA